MDNDDALKLFAITNQLLEYDLDAIEQEHGVDLDRNHSRTIEADREYYPQIEASIRAEAAAMAPHYEIFYSLELTIRSLVADSLEAEEGGEWWSSGRIPDRVKQEAEKRQRKETDAAVTPRSDLPIDFTTFGELGEIIKSNWDDVFGQTFTSQKAVEQVMARLNTLRAPVAHCSPLAEDEVLRLRLSVRDWFRLME